MQTTPFKNVQHHTDGRHVFTVTAGEERKQFVTTATINAQQALTNALKWRDSQTGVPLAEADKPKIDWFISSLEEPSRDFVASMRIPASRPEPRRMIIPDHLKQKLNGNIIASSSVTPVTNDPRIRTLREGRNRRFPSLPAGVTPSVTTYLNGNSPSLAFMVNYRLNGKATSRSFYLGIIGTISLAKYRAVRHVAIKFREEYLRAKSENREMDLDAFVGYYEKLRNNTFRWPFAGSVPDKLSSRVKSGNGRAVHAFHTKRMNGRNPKHPSLPLGVTLKRQRKEGKTDQILFQVSYADNRGTPKIKTYYAGLAGNLNLRRYRMARHVAMAFRKEYLDARITKRSMRLELFEDWKEKMIAGVFFVPFNRQVSDATYEQTRIPVIPDSQLLNTRAGLTARDVIDTLKEVPEISAALAGLPKERLDQIVLMIRNPINDALYTYQKK